ncbi:unnamed protein product [Lactuca saligna]|uniref:Uncharacterized protein n=1 Tax=Lactuca saligna TaxID=75948 RepID=A0AA35YVK2_LACSI|nr:unnamed protein product [Lactuca saligna]
MNRTSPTTIASITICVCFQTPPLQHRTTTPALSHHHTAFATAQNHHYTTTVAYFICVVGLFQRLENTLNYGLERVWAVGYMKGSRRFRLGCWIHEGFGLLDLIFFLQLQVSFFSDDEETTSTPKADALFIPRENPRALVIHPLKQWPGKSSAEKLKNASSPAQTNGDYTGFASSPPLNGRSTENGNRNHSENGTLKEQTPIKTP